MSRRKVVAEEDGQKDCYQKKGGTKSDVPKAGKRAKMGATLRANNGLVVTSTQHKILSGLSIPDSDIRHCNVLSLARTSRNCAEKLIQLGKELGVLVGEMKQKL